MEKLYNEFETPEDVRRYYNIQESTKPIEEPITEVNQETEDPEDPEKETPSEDLPVVYADLKFKECKNIFEHWVVFTNSKDPKENKTLKNILDAIKSIKKSKSLVPELHLFLAEKTIATETEEGFSIRDDDDELDFEGLNNANTLVFSRLGVQGEGNCEEVLNIIQDRGFLVLNPLQPAQIASNKYKTAALLRKNDIPQPNFALLSIDIIHNEELFNERMKDVNEKWNPKDSDKNEELKFVVKILDGHGGTGVFMTDGKKLMAILQTIFAVDPERELIIQSKEEADGGDIRVHVLTLRDRQVILGAMKRVKISGDFRSNVSLGATAEKVVLTPEQEQIALRAAMYSKLPWCAVDIMPLVKGSNKELGDNVVLELNASPGTDGITDVLGVNFVNVMVNELTNPKEFFLQDKQSGYVEAVELSLDEGHTLELLGKLDTGNGTKATCLTLPDLQIDEDHKKVTFSVQGTTFEKEYEDVSNPIVGGNKTTRPIVKFHSIRLGNRMIFDIPIALAKEPDIKKNTNILLNREMLSWMGYVINPSKTHLLTKEIEKTEL